MAERCDVYGDDGPCVLQQHSPEISHYFYAHRRVVAPGHDEAAAMAEAGRVMEELAGMLGFAVEVPAMHVLRCALQRFEDLFALIEMLGQQRRGGDAVALDSAIGERIAAALERSAAETEKLRTTLHVLTSALVTTPAGKKLLAEFTAEEQPRAAWMEGDNG